MPRYTHVCWRRHTRSIGFNMEYAKALEQAALLADHTGQSAFIIGDGDDYAVLNYEPKLLGGRSIQEVLPAARDADPVNHA
jgi:hypothetical protein